VRPPHTMPRDGRNERHCLVTRPRLQLHVPAFWERLWLASNHNPARNAGTGRHGWTKRPEPGSHSRPTKRRPSSCLAGQRPAAQASIIRPAMLIVGGTVGSSSGANQPASAISSACRANSPATYRARNPTISECGNGHGWLPQ
jgi:hypothetical protein